MSLGVYIDCDQCSDTLTAGPVGSGSIIRNEAREHGWHPGLPGGMDLCDGCWNEGWRVIMDKGQAVLFMTGRKRRIA